MTLERLKQEGWHVDQLKLQALFEDDYDENMGAQELKKILLDEDIKEWGNFAINHRRDESGKSFQGPAILQLKSWRNANKPKMADHMGNDGVCMMMFTDGAGGSIRGMQDEDNRIEIDGNTPVGTKILLFGTIPMERDFLLLTRQNCKILGGHVDKLVEKWKAERFFGYKDRKTSSGAPDWIPFGKKNIKGSKTAEKLETETFKAMSALNIGSQKPKDDSEAPASEFEEARKAEIERVRQEQMAKKIDDAVNRKPNKPVLAAESNMQNSTSNQGEYQDSRQKHQEPTDLPIGQPRTFENSNRPSSHRSDFNGQERGGYQERDSYQPRGGRSYEARGGDRFVRGGGRGYEDAYQDDYQPRGGGRGRGRGGGGRGGRNHDDDYQDDYQPRGGQGRGRGTRGHGRGYHDEDSRPDSSSRGGRGRGRSSYDDDRESDRGSNRGGRGNFGGSGGLTFVRGGGGRGRGGQNYNEEYQQDYQPRGGQGQGRSGGGGGRDRGFDDERDSQPRGGRGQDRGGRGRGRGGRRGGRGRSEDDNEYALPKTNSSTLFDFMKDQVPTINYEGQQRNQYQSNASRGQGRGQRYNQY